MAVWPIKKKGFLPAAKTLRQEPFWLSSQSPLNLLDQLTHTGAGNLSQLPGFDLFETAAVDTALLFDDIRGQAVQIQPDVVQ